MVFEGYYQAAITSTGCAFVSHNRGYRDYGVPKHILLLNDEQNTLVIKQLRYS